MFRRIVPCVGVLALGFVLAGCNDMAPGAATPPTNATLDTGSHVSGQSGSPLNGGAAAVGTRPSGAMTTTPVPPVQ
jgi:hypothetical protein